MEYSVDKTTRKDRIKLVKKALAISISGADVPTDETLNLTKDYVDGKIELEELQQKIIDKYFEKTQMAFKVIEARDKDLGQGQTFADFIRHSYQIKGELEQIHVQGKNALQYISDYGEMSDRGKTTKSKIIRGFGYLGKKLDYPPEKQEEIENSRILGKTELTEDETENLRTMLLNGKTDAESKEIVDDFVGRYTGALAEEKSFFDAIPSQLDFSKFKTEEIGIDEYIKKQEAKHISMKDIVKNAISNGLDLEQVEQMDRVENVLSNERNEEGVTKDE